MASELNKLMARITKTSMDTQKRSETYTKNMEIEASLPDDYFKTPETSYTIKDDIVVDKLIANVVKNTFDFKVSQAEKYAKAVGMDDANTKMLVVAETQGYQAAAKAMMEDCGGDYAAMRARYG